MSDQLIQHVVDSDFNREVLEAAEPVLVDFWAEWCGPCKMIAPVLEELAEEYAGKLKVCKLNVDTNGATPKAYSIRGIPTLILFKDGKVEETHVGSSSKLKLKEFIDKVIT